MTELERVHDDLFTRVRARPGLHWWSAFALCGAGTGMLGVLIAYTVATGIGVWGTNIPTGWAFAIINFVFWIGIGHAGTFISAILYLLEQNHWRNPISRLTETMTVFAVVQAALFPILHLGRPWFAYWLLPYPDVMGVWPQVKSALPWDAAAVTTYLTVSVVFWYVGMIPDLASLRDHAPSLRARKLYGLLAIGWRGDSRSWRHWKVTYLMLASIATPLVVSVHSVVSSDFAIGLTPGWHSTLQPPYFVGGAIFSGFAMVLVLAIPIRVLYGIEHVITDRILDNCAKLMLVTGWIVTYGYIVEHFGAYYSGEPAERSLMFGHHPGSLAFWTMLSCNAIIPQLLWWRRVRRAKLVLFVISVLVLVGLWFERYVIIVQGLMRDQLPSAWGSYTPTWVDLGILVGTFGFFGLLFLVFLRLMPFVPVSEIKEEVE
ncbi:MAG TPA: NrfD/PsrC family molybdoenzyme membrane anchor subunit [Kofleriaceae bacterium]|nr:NrfD/PsrC family molybdoenzyme membrane anchor subunit [Kofleriaceae bacterium]